MGPADPYDPGRPLVPSMRRLPIIRQGMGARQLCRERRSRLVVAQRERL